MFSKENQKKIRLIKIYCRASLKNFISEIIAMQGT